MELHSLILDSFLDEPYAVRNLALAGQFRGVISPYDGYKFPNICPDIPKELRAEVERKLQIPFGVIPKIKESIFRITTLDYSPYQYVHTDQNIGKFACLIYLNYEFPESSGTEIMFPRDVHSFDQNKPTDWFPTVSCAMKFNRAFIFNAGHFHGALPRNGFGTTKEDSRLIFISWFDL